jgi:glycosyltransferase involved in cell wall biosynthesis
LSIKPKLLFIADWYAPAFKGGGPIRSVVNLIEKIKKDYDCYVYTSNTDFGEVEPLAGIVEDQWVNQSGVQVYYRSGKMSFAQVKKMIKTIDPHRIYLNSMFSNMIKPILVGYASDRMIIAPRGMLNESALAVKPIRKFLYLWFLRTFGFVKHLRFHATSKDEKKVIQRIFPNAQSIIVAGNIPASTSADLHPAEKQSGKLNMVFTGRMHPIKNLHLLLEALKNVSGAIELTIIATKEDQDYQEKCKQLALELPGNITINWVLNLPPNEIQQHLLNAHLFTLLSEVESFGHAIFEALAVGCPVLIGDNTPWKHLEQQKAGIDLPINNMHQITSGIQQFVDMENQEWQSCRKGAHGLALSYLDQLDVDKLYCTLFEN